MLVSQGRKRRMIIDGWMKHLMYKARHMQNQSQQQRKSKLRRQKKPSVQPAVRGTNRWTEGSNGTARDECANYIMKTKKAVQMSNFGQKNGRKRRSRSVYTFSISSDSHSLASEAAPATCKVNTQQVRARRQNPKESNRVTQSG
mmetsp:Transcript_39430/g.77579  ORF Transcript_39430/g.77579 Transcript_39430/m.77579 type:complete len:144 (-) Transcript_39430:2582-3013(-)